LSPTTGETIRQINKASKRKGNRFILCSQIVFSFSDWDADLFLSGAVLNYRRIIPKSSNRSSKPMQARFFRRLLPIVVFVVCSVIASSAQSGRQVSQPVATIPPPETVLGFKIGEDRKLANWERFLAYFKRLTETSDRIKLDELGKSNAWKTVCRSDDFFAGKSETAGGVQTDSTAFIRSAIADQFHRSRNHRFDSSRSHSGRYHLQHSRDRSRRHIHGN
jgi:hypothetical protein